MMISLRSTTLSSLLSSLLLLSATTTPSVVNAAGCHGMSRFRLAPVTKSADMTTEQKKQQGMASVDDKKKYCQEEFGNDATLMDLALMEGEFTNNPQNLQHALRPLFDNDPHALYYVTDHGQETLVDALHHHDHGYDASTYRYVLAFEATNHSSIEPQFNPQRVTGNFFLETRPVDSNENAYILCHISKPKYSTTATMTNMEEMADVESVPTNGKLMSFLAVVAVAALALAALQTYRAKTANAMLNGGGNPFAPQASDYGGSYRILSTNGDLTQSLSTSTTDMELA